MGLLSGLELNDVLACSQFKSGVIAVQDCIDQSGVVDIERELRSAEIVDVLYLDGEFLAVNAFVGKDIPVSSGET